MFPKKCIPEALLLNLFENHFSGLFAFGKQRLYSDGLRTSVSFTILPVALCVRGPVSCLAVLLRVWGREDVFIVSQKQERLTCSVTCLSRRQQ